MSNLTPDEIRRLPKRARDQIAAALAQDDQRHADRVQRTATGDVGGYRCAACGNVERPEAGVRKYALTRADEHADTFGHHRYELILHE